MPPRVNSRYIFTLGIKDVDAPDQLQLTDREPFLFQDLADNRVHIVGEGDTLFGLAARYFAGYDSAANLWWIIADFQPDPIQDPTIRLVPGQKLVIPSMRTLQERVFSPKRATEDNG